jgi:hypothetical protein
MVSTPTTTARIHHAFSVSTRLGLGTGRRRTYILWLRDEVLVPDSLVFILLDIVVRLGFHRFLLWRVGHFSLYRFLFYRQNLAPIDG